MANEAKKVLLGLDLGTNSVGWCVTDENSSIIKKNGKSLWGSRLFDEASDAKTRRINRTSRRRLDRRKRRMALLKEIFNEEIRKVDSLFFGRLEESAYHIEDKAKSGYRKYSLFNDDGFTDRDFYDSKTGFPTIYHLRDYLYKTEEKADIRFIYLAIAHMIKYRGNFNYEGQTFKACDAEQLKDYFLQLNDILSVMADEYMDTSVKCDVEEFSLDDGFEKAINKRVLNARGVSKKKEALKNIFSSQSSYLNNVVIPLISGGTVSLSKLFCSSSDEDFETIKSVSFSDSKFDEENEEIHSLNADKIECQLLDICKKIYDYIILGNILGDCENISEAMIKRYQKHASDLKELKNYIRRQDNDVKPEDRLFNKIFRIKKDNVANYVSYVGFTKTGGNKITAKHCSKSDFYKYLKDKLGLKKFKKAEEIENPYLKKIYTSMEVGDFLPRINSSDNGVLPYQLNFLEMDKILRTQSRYYPFLNQSGDGLTNIEKIEKLLTFRIPYYVGPAKGPHSWAVYVKNGERKEIYPWNFFDIIDKNESAASFIKRMLNKCTYLPSCDCLPLNSLMYQEYMVYSYLNKLQVNGGPITADQKVDIVEKLFKKRKTVTKRNIQNFFGDKAEIETINQKEIENAIPCLSSYVFFSNVFGEDFLNENLELVEKIIVDLTVFEDSEIVKERLLNVYGIKDEKIINKIKNRRMSGWGRLSKELLQLKTPVVLDTGEIVFKTLLTIMRETNSNLMELINDDEYEFGKQIDEANVQKRKEFYSQKEKHDAIVDYVDGCYVSPGMKRPLIQAMAIIEDVQKILHRPIDEYYIECTRTSKAKKERSKTRKDILDEYYKKALEFAKQDIKDKIESEKKQKEVSELKKELEQCADKLRSDKYFLYFLQLGKCVYSGERIELSSLQNNNVYDIDHIIPQALVKDDSLDNRVLVKAEKNREKSCVYPIPSGHISPSGRALIEKLHKIHYMDDKKYSNLIRTRELDESELTTFINRQLVYTNQAVKALTGLIKQFETTANGGTPKIVYSKAENVSDFRKDYEIVKSRDANHFHHAHDAYLNICVGRAIDTYYSRYKHVRLRNLIGQKVSLNVRNVFKQTIGGNGTKQTKSNIIDADGSIVWDYKNSLQAIKSNIFERHDIMVTTMQYIKRGSLIDATIKSKGETNLVPLKNKGPLVDTKKYGGRTGVQNGFYAYAEYIKGTERKKNLFAIPIMFSDGSDERKTLEYLNRKYPDYEGLKLLIPVVRVNALIKQGLSCARITGTDSADKSYYIKNASEIYYDQASLLTIRKLSKLIKLFDKNKLSFKPKKQEDFNKINDFLNIDIDGAIIISPSSNERTKAVVLKDNELADLFEVLNAKMNAGIMKLFCGIQAVKSAVSDDDVKASYSLLPIWQKAYVLNQIVLLISGQSSFADLSLLYKEYNAKDGEWSYKNGKAVGKNRIGSTLNDIDGVFVESPTGFYTKNLLKGKTDVL